MVIAFPHRGEIFLTMLEPVRGSEQGKTRPCVIVQNDIINKFSPTTIVAPITSRIFEDGRYSHTVSIDSRDSMLEREGTVLLGQVRCVDKTRLVRKMGRIVADKMRAVDAALKFSLGLDSLPNI